jgi:polar amino acid transport system substrate-binding protein
MEIDSGYVARPGSGLQSAQDVDRAGIRVAVAQGSPADGFLTRTLKHAEIIRLFAGSTIEVAARDALSFGRADVYAEATHLAYRIAAQVPGATVLLGRFSVTQMSIAVPKSNAAALPAVNDFVQEAKRSGPIAEAIKRAGLAGGGVRPGR